jgi:ATP-binding cassette subfamily B protein
MMIEINQASIPAFLSQIQPFAQLETKALQAIAAKCQIVRYRIGQPILVRERMPAQIAIIYQGQVRLLGYDRRAGNLFSLQLLEAGEILGCIGLLRGIPCEIATASTEVICITLAAQEFLDLMTAKPAFAEIFSERAALCEVFELLSVELQRRADGTANLKDLALKIWQDTEVINLKPGKLHLSQLDPHLVWLVSSGSISDFPVGSRLPTNLSQATLRIEGKGGARLIGLPIPEVGLIPEAEINDEEVVPEKEDKIIKFPTTNNGKSISNPTIIDAPEQPPESPLEPKISRGKYPFVGGRGTVNVAMACLHMLAKHLRVPFRRDVVRKVVENQFKNAGSISLQFMGAVTEMMGLRAQLVQVPVTAVNRLKAPALTTYGDSFALIYSITEKELVVAIPEKGIVRKKPTDFAKRWGNEGQLLLLQPPVNQSKEQFSLRWFVPSINRYRPVLIEVLIASVFVQIFGLANPIITQVIIDKVLIQKSLDTLDVLGIFLLGVAVFEAVLTSLRTYLFVDTTNRIDIGLAAEVIDHLLRLPLRYFERRPIGELAGRINELENIRQFLTGTALTVVLDAIFSVIYIAVMIFYSWLLTIVALATVPLFGLLTMFVSPIVRRQLRTKAERYAETQSYLVEVLSGVQTVKAQNIELKSRWQWQERYSKYISAGFKNVLTSSTAGSISGFLNKFSGLLLLWVGARLVLDGKLTLGQLIAFRIIAGYVTSPLLRLIQLWQTFQETALSIERLGDVLDSPQEVDEADKNNIPLPEIQGAVKIEDIYFSFKENGPLQLVNINLDFPAGSFVGIVGQSGSGKSTLTKLIPRLYEAKSGRIKIDGYDISKVDLYSLRRQIGFVLQDTLLFQGTVKENIALTKPEASDEEIIAAAKTAVAHDFIMSLPNGYNTQVGERGSGLSGGQRQRIAIARTVLQNPSLLILDEATSALDYNSERQVCDNLADVFQGKTVFFITHRLSTVKNADIILVMDQGSVVEQGTHQELIALKGRYYCLYQQQESQL